MASVGERLRHERESRNTTIEQMAGATQVELRYLEALERNDLGSMPGRAFGKLYIRAYADVLGFDPQPLIEDYDREHRGPPERHAEPAGPRPVEAAIARWREAKLAERRPAEPPAIPAEPAVESVPPQAEIVAPVSMPRRPMRFVVIASVAVALLIAAAWLARVVWMRPGSSAAERVAATPGPTPAPPIDRGTAPASPVAAPAPSHLTVGEFGVGRRVVGRRLEGRVDRFAPGEVAWFQTQVLGGAAGESVRHVWLHEGRPVYSIELELGGPRWRTHSRATLGHAGPWAVEARDAQGRVFARAEFDCK